MQRNRVPLGGEWFANTTMEKALATSGVLAGFSLFLGPALTPLRSFPPPGRHVGGRQPAVVVEIVRREALARKLLELV